MTRHIFVWNNPCEKGMKINENFNQIFQSITVAEGNFSKSKLINITRENSCKGKLFDLLERTASIVRPKSTFPFKIQFDIPKIVHADNGIESRKQLSSNETIEILNFQWESIVGSHMMLVAVV